jgi:lipoprotein-anchoring transpeptidase ErfK/SrfK
VARGKHSKRAWGRGWVVGLALGVAMLALGGGTAFAAYRYDHASAAHILAGVSIDGVDVGGMTRDEAVRAVASRADGTLTRALTVSAAGSSWVVSAEGLGTRADVEGAVDAAFGVASQLSFFSRVYHRLADQPVTTKIALGYTYDDQAVGTFVQRVYGDVARSPVDAAIRLVDDQLVVRRPRVGQALKTYAASSRILSALQRHLTSVQVPMKTVQPQITAHTVGKTIVVDLSENRLYLYDGLKIAKEFPVATAAPGYTTPVGTWKVVNKAENPTWFNPAPDGWGAGEPLVIPPGPGNPLGTRALYLSAPGIRIHGTYNSASIGTYASHGCIRMYISDSEELYPLVPMGTKVIIKP